MIVPNWDLFLWILLVGLLVKGVILLAEGADSENNRAFNLLAGTIIIIAVFLVMVL